MRIFKRKPKLTPKPIALRVFLADETAFEVEVTRVSRLVDKAMVFYNKGRAVAYIPAKEFRYYMQVPQDEIKENVYEEV